MNRRETLKYAGAALAGSIGIGVAAGRTFRSDIVQELEVDETDLIDRISLDDDMLRVEYSENPVNYFEDEGVDVNGIDAKLYLDGEIQSSGWADSEVEEFPGVEGDGTYSLILKVLDGEQVVAADSRTVFSMENDGIVEESLAYHEEFYS